MAKGKSRRTRSRLPSPGLDIPSDDIEALLQAALRLSERDDDDPSEEALDRAQEIALDALEAPTPKARISLARKALGVSPLCADAYTVLAEEAASPPEAVEFYRQALDAATQALGPDRMSQFEGEFWLALETRPYMRALAGLAQSLWDSGQRGEAVAQYQEMLRLNSNDNQGARYVLADALLEMGRDEEAQALLDRYREDDSAAWLWSTALLQYRRLGDSPDSRQSLAAAKAGNPHVEPYLTGRRQLPKNPPMLIGYGDESEAQAYVFGALAAWDAAPGAKAWAAAGQPRPPSGATKQAGIDTEAVDQAVLALLYMNLHADNRAWKTFDWDAMGRLYDKDLVSNPATQAKSVAFTEQGLAEARQAFERLFRIKPRPGA